ncbi:RNA-directed DNA polymerase, eukaryota [Tanacetum coccineum]
MEGTVFKDMERIIDLEERRPRTENCFISKISKGLETKAEKVSDMEIKSLWGNTNFDAIVSQSLGFDDMTYSGLEFYYLNDSKLGLLKTYHVIHSWGNAGSLSKGGKLNGLSGELEAPISRDEIRRAVCGLCMAFPNSCYMGVPTTAFQFHRGIKIDSSMTLSHLFYADDAVFYRSNGLVWYLTGIMHTLRCFSLLSRPRINLKKAKLIGVGRLTLLKSVLGSTPIYNMSLFKVPKQVLKSMESIRRNFFNGIRDGEKKMLGLVVGFGDFLSRGSIECGPQVLHALHGSNTKDSFAPILRCGVLLLKNVTPLNLKRWEESAQAFSDFMISHVRRLLDDMLLPKSDVPSRWVKQIPIKVNVLAWKISMDRLPTRVNLHRRGVQVSPISCPICCEALENLDHLLFCCDLAKDIARFNQVQNKCWKECFTLPGGVSGHIETISSSLIQIFEKMVFLKT